MLTFYCRIDYSIASHLDTLKFECRNLDKLTFLYINEPDKFNVSNKVIKNRQKKIETFIQKKDEIEMDITKIIKPSICKLNLQFLNITF